MLATRAERLEIVARLRIREHLSVPEIVKRLAEMGMVNVLTRKPFSKSTVATDCTFLKERSIERANATIDEHRAHVLDEIDEVAEVAWAKTKGSGKKVTEDPDLPIILSATKQRRAVTGTDAPTKISPTDPTGQKEYGADVRNILISKLLPDFTGESETEEAGESDG